MPIILPIPQLCIIEQPPLISKVVIEKKRI